MTHKKISKLIKASPTKKLLSSQTVKTAAHLGGLVRQVRAEHGLSQAEAAALCRVGTRFFSDLENGKPSLQISKVFQVLQSFGLTLEIHQRNGE